MSNQFPATLDEGRLHLWRQLMAEIASLPAADPQAICDLVANLMIDWSSNPGAMRDVLSTGVSCGELDSQVVTLWESRRSAGNPLGGAEAGRNPTALRPAEAAGGMVPDEAHSRLHPALRAIAQALSGGRSRSGRDALATGQKLLQARELCDQHGVNFEFFLQQLDQSLGLHRASAYLYIKFAECEFPLGLGTAVMKWIAQGFPKGGGAARLIAQRALAEGLTLTQLEARFGRLRPSRAGRGITETRELSRYVAHSPRGQALLQKKEALSAELQRLENELHAIDQELLQLALSVDTAALDSAAEPPTS